ncbi:MAG TPA: M1 family metallopeptidase [Gaiellaceae bacterium]|nr:M1 family metallopeptidase [Gaiellaceae bacterium]
MRVALAGCALFLLTAGAAAGADFTPGSAGLGDPFFPRGGNGGYDVANYELKLAYDPATDVLDGKAVVTAKATQNLSRFDLDLRGFQISKLTVNGVNASFARDGQELVITPAAGIRSGSTFRVAVDYRGVPEVITDPDFSIEGFIPTDDGAFVVGEPQGSPGWFPCNDNPTDKATYDFAVTVPAGLTAMANGLLVSSATSNGSTTWVWKETDPMATYLATSTLGKFDLSISKMADGLPVYVAVDPQLAKGQVLSKLTESVDFYSSLYGPYPFNAVGAIVDSAKVVGYSLETQTKPNFPYVPDEATLVHEISHMWFGDSVTLTQWPDIWLHEGFATWSEWIWSERQGNKSAAQWFKQLYSTPAQNTRFWTPPAGNPGTVEFLFNGTIYYRGGLTVQALREKVGEFTFSRIIRDWAAQNRYGNVTTAQFIALAEKISGQDLGHFFDVWLYQSPKPTSW